jgi:hypothetical protein
VPAAGAADDTIAAAVHAVTPVGDAVEWLTCG